MRFFPFLKMYFIPTRTKWIFKGISSLLVRLTIYRKAQTRIQNSPKQNLHFEAFFPRENLQTSLIPVLIDAVLP